MAVIYTVYDHETEKRIADPTLFEGQGPAGDAGTFNVFETMDCQCSFCYEHKATAHWVAKDHIKVCSECALKVLPALIADAVVGESVHRDYASEQIRVKRNHLNFESQMRDVQMNFFRSAANALNTAAHNMQIKPVKA